MVRPAEAPERDSSSELWGQFRAEQVASWVAGAGVLLLAVVYREPWGAALAAAVAVMALIRLPSFAAIARNDVVAAIWWDAAGTWGIAMVVAAVIPDALPIMVLNIIGPLITGAMYLGASDMKRLIVAGVVASIVLGALGFRSEGTGVEDAIPEWLFQLIMIVYLALHLVVTSVSVSIANRVRLATLIEVEATNRALLAADIELRESRRRVISVGDEERVRLERNIHDGAQQRLVALAVQLQLAAQLTRRGSPLTADQLDQFHRESREGIADLRELARGIYPSVLSERGLADALRGVATRSPVPIEVAVDDTVDLPRTDAAAVYFICLEAMQNVAKHAPDSSARLTVRRPHGGGCVITVADDGPGFDPLSIPRSRGLLNMADRAGALGGELTVDSRPGAGTRITVSMPSLTSANLAG